MCHVHFVRDVLRKLPRKRWKEIAERLNESLKSVEKLQVFITELEEKGVEKAAKTCERFIFALFNYQKYPRSHWKRIKTTNMLERINKELKRRTRVVGTFPNDAALLRLAVAVLLDINKEWLLGRRYLTMES